MHHCILVGRRRVSYILMVFAAIGLVSTAHAQTDLARAYKIIAGKELVDLTHSFGPDTPVWSGFGQAKMTPATDPQTGQPYTIAKDGFHSTYCQMVGQYGTHVDPPAHFAEGRKLYLVGRGVGSYHSITGSW